jgi:hypothetical protein
MNNPLHRIFWQWSKYYYVEGITIILVIFLLIKTLRLESFNPFKKYLILYLLAAIILFTSAALFFAYQDAKHTIKYVEIMNTWFSCIELYVFYKFFNPHWRLGIQTGLKYITWILIVVLVALIVIFICQDDSTLTAIKASEINKISETSDAIKRLLFTIPCLMYFIKMFRENLHFVFIEVLVVYAIFAYAIFGILGYSIGSNISNYAAIKKIVSIIPALALWVIYMTMYFFIKGEKPESQGNKLSYKH